MAAAQHKLSRRALLGAACAAPVLGAVEGPLLRHPGLDPGSAFSPSAHPGRGSSALESRVEGPPPQARRMPDRVRHDEKWNRALARLLAAETALAAMQGAGDEPFGRALDRLYAALRTLFRAPSPDVAALALKLDLLIAHEIWELEFAEPALAALRRDARRLSRSS